MNPTQNQSQVQEESRDDQTLWTTPQAAHYLRIGSRALFNLRRRGFPYIQLGGAIRYDPAQVKAYLAQTPRLVCHRQRQIIRSEKRP